MFEQAFRHIDDVSIYQQKLAAPVELKQSRLQEAFSGALTAGKKELDATVRDEKAA